MIDKDNKTFFLKALDNNVHTHYEFYFNVYKCKNLKEEDAIALEDRSYSYYARTMSDCWVISLYMTFPFLSDLSILDLTKTLYNSVKRHDINNLLSIVTYLDSDDSPHEYSIKITVNPEFIIKKLIAEGFGVRTELGVDIDVIQESLSEYSYTFKNLDFLDNFVLFFKDIIRDSSYAAI
jgi:hypothetical protein